MKNWTGIIACVLLSACLWLIHNLSQPFTQLVSVPILVMSDFEGRSSVPYSEVTVVARCRASGYGHLALSMRRDAVQIMISHDEFTGVPGDGNYRLPVSALVPYSESIFGSDVAVESYVTEALLLHYESENFIKVPVVPVFKTAFRPQYTASSQIVVKPDSVLLYGSPESLENISYVPTFPQTLKDVHKDVHDMAALNVPAGIRPSVWEVEYSMEVTRYVEIRSHHMVSVVNAPAGSSLVVYPPVIDVVYQCTFPVPGNPVDNVGFYVDYNEFATSITGKCMVHPSGLPNSVISYTVEPETCNCIELRTE